MADEEISRPASVLEEFVTQVAGAWDLWCPITDGTCGDKGVPFTSTAWPTQEHALLRLREHVESHGEGADPQSSLEDFRAKHGLSVNDDGVAVVTVKDLL